MSRAGAPLRPDSHSGPEILNARRLLLPRRSAAHDVDPPTSAMRFASAKGTADVLQGNERVWQAPARPRGGSQGVGCGLWGLVQAAHTPPPQYSACRPGTPPAHLQNKRPQVIQRPVLPRAHHSSFVAASPFTILMMRLAPVTNTLNRPQPPGPVHAARGARRLDTPPPTGTHNPPQTPRALPHTPAPCHTPAPIDNPPHPSALPHDHVGAPTTPAHLATCPRTLDPRIPSRQAHAPTAPESPCSRLGSAATTASAGHRSAGADGGPVALCDCSTFHRR